MQKDKSSQGIVLDEKSQEQPNDKERARTGSYAAAAGKEGRRASAGDWKLSRFAYLKVDDLVPRRHRAQGSGRDKGRRVHHPRSDRGHAGPEQSPLFRDVRMIALRTEHRPRSAVRHRTAPRKKWLDGHHRHEQ